jgi:starvation-inducible DNA-binding protein
VPEAVGARPASNEEEETMTPKLGLSDGHREAVVNILNVLLSDEYVLSTKTRNFHWNVVGPHFNDLHKLFEAQYTELNEVVDEVAERARSLGGRAFGTLAEFTKSTRLTEDAGATPSAPEMLATLLADHERLATTLREDITAVTDRYADVGTADFLTGLLTGHEKTAWMLRASLG